VRPEPISSVAPPLRGRPLIRQGWREAVFLHWRVDPGDVARLLPAGTRPDEYEGAAWVGLIPFRLEGTAIPRLPPVPWLGTFLEANVRVYSVDEQGRRGVVFLTLEAQHLLPVLAARAGVGVPYRWARMRSARRGSDLFYAAERLAWRARPRTRIRVRLTDEAVTADPLADFLTARWGMHVRRAGRTTYWRNEHEPWPLFRAELVDLRDELLADSGFPGLAERPPDSVLYSPGVTSRFSRPQP
jgi:uncharacterized protein YqjF (DUF2071 family)